MVKNILQLGDPRLRQTSAPFPVGYRLLEEVWNDLLDTKQQVMKQHNFRRCAGLSGVQIGHLFRVCLIWSPLRGFTCAANPEILSRSQETAVEFEGCLSFFDKRGKVPRSTQLVVSYYNEHWKHITEELRDWDARILQHEIDHMDGVLYTDRMEPGEELLDYETYKALGY